jgi:hypothetical protein
VVSFTPRSLYSCVMRPRYPLERILGGPQNRSGRRGKRKSLTLPGLEHRIKSVVANEHNSQLMKKTPIQWPELDFCYRLSMIRILACTVQCSFSAALGRGRAAAVALPRTSLNLPPTFIGLVYSQFELIEIKSKN